MGRNFKLNRLSLLIIGIAGFYSPNSLNAQTWVTTDFWDGYYGVYSHRDSTMVGPFAMCKTPNGNIYTLIQENVGDRQCLIMMNATLNLYIYMRLCIF